MFSKFRLLFFFSFLFAFTSYSQQKGFRLPDSLSSKSFEYFYNQSAIHETDTTKTLFYIDAWIAKAKKEKNFKELTDAYDEKIYFSKLDLRLKYADSAVIAAYKTKDNAIIGSAIHTQGGQNLFRKNNAIALDLFLLADTYISKTNDEELKHMVKLSIANIKVYLGFYSESLKLYTECMHFYQKHDNWNSNRNYLNSLFGIGTCFTRLGQYEKASEINATALKESRRLKIPKSEKYIIGAEGINQYFRKNYTRAIAAIESALPTIKQNNDFSGLAISYFYIGKCWWDMGEKENAIPYFKKVDRAFTEQGYMRPDVRENYELLVNYYKSKGDVRSELHYINTLIKADSVLNINFRYMSGKMHKDYDLKALSAAKKDAERKLAGAETKTLLLYGTIALLFFMTLYIFYRYYTNQKIYRDKFEALMQEKTEIIPVAEVTPTEKKAIDINPEVVEKILEKLQKFEERRKFREKDITLVQLAGTFGTNANYLSKVVQAYRGMNFNIYINDVRIKYTIDLLKTQPKYRNYTIKALAEESGFSTPQHFSKAFFAIAGIYPSYFLEELNKNYGETDIL